MPRRGIAAGAAVAALLGLVAGCGMPASRLVIDARPAAAHEAIQPAAGEGSLGRLRLRSGKHKPGRLSSGSNAPTFGNALFGGNDGLVKEEGALGRRLAIVRVYYHIGENFPVIFNREQMAAGSTLLVSLDSSGTSYASIAAGRQDGTIRAFLQAVNRAAIQYHLRAIYVSFEHEPDGPQHAGLGSPAAFVRAWDHVHQLAESAHLDWNDGGRLHWVLILIHNTWASGGAGGYWPGAGEVDIVAGDGYNSFGCGRWQKQVQTPAELFNPLLGFARAHGGLPVFIAEWGSDTVRSAQPQFIREMQAYVTANRAIAATMYWDDGGGACSYWVDGHPASLAALAAMGHSPLMQGSVSGT